MQSFFRHELLGPCFLALVTVSLTVLAEDELEPFANAAFQNRPISCRISDRFEIYNPHSLEHLEAIKSMGFDQVVLDWPNLHSEASKLGLDIVIANWWTKDSKPTEIDERLDFLNEVDNKHLAAVSMMDEPERYAPETPFSFYQSLYEELQAKLKTVSRSVPLEISHWGPLSRWQLEDYQNFTTLYRATDRIRLMPYPDLDEGPLDEVFYQMMRSRYIMKLAGREIPQLVILQTWVIPDAPKLPTIKELRVMAYQAILCGAETTSFFNYDPDVWKRTPGFRAGFRELMKELVQFTQEHRGRQCEANMNADGILTAKIDVSSDQILVLRINTNRTAVDQLAALEMRTENSLRPATMPADRIAFSDGKNDESLQNIAPSVLATEIPCPPTAHGKVACLHAECASLSWATPACRRSESQSDCRPRTRRLLGRLLHR